MSHSPCISQQGIGEELSEHAKTSESIGKIAARKNLSQSDLALLLGVDRSMVTRYLAGTSAPGALPCLLLADLADGQDEKQEWIDRSRLSADQMAMIGRSLHIKPTAHSGEERALLAWWRKPNGSIEESIKRVVEELLSRSSKVN